MTETVNSLNETFDKIFQTFKNKFPESIIKYNEPEKVKATTSNYVSQKVNMPLPVPIQSFTTETSQMAEVISPDKPEEDVSKSQEEKEDEELIKLPQPDVEPLGKEEATEFPIKAAGRELKLEATNWLQGRNDILTKVNVIGQKMEELSTIHSRIRSNPIAKKEMIQKSLEITSATNSLLQQCKELGELCTDKLLKNQLFTTIDRIKTLSQQLRVVTAVKASNPNDLDSDNQLFSCASNLAETIKVLLRNSEAASVRCTFKTGGTVGLAVIKFKKNLARKQNSNNYTHKRLNSKRLSKISNDSNAFLKTIENNDISNNLYRNNVPRQ